MDLEEYGCPSSIPDRSVSHKRRRISGEARRYQPDTEDSNVIILGKFQDIETKPSPSRSESLRGPGVAAVNEPAAEMLVPAESGQRVQNVLASNTPAQDPPKEVLTYQPSRDDRLIWHYRTCVRRHLMQIYQFARCISPVTNATSEEDFFEQQASHFPPVSYILPNSIPRLDLGSLPRRF